MMASHGNVIGFSLILLFFASIIASSDSGQIWCSENTYADTPDKYGVIVWKKTKAGQQAKYKCTAGNTKGWIYRSCTASGSWEMPDFSECENATNGKDNSNKMNKTNNGNNASPKGKAQKAKNDMKSGSPKDKSKKDVDKAVSILEEVAMMKDKLNETAVDIIETIGNIMDVDQTALTESRNASSRVVKILELIAENIPTDQKTKTKTLNTTNLVLQAVDVTRKSFPGISFGVSSQGVVSGNSEKTKTSVKLPGSVLSNAQSETVRVGFILYGNNKLFQESDKQRDVITSKEVLSSSVYNVSTSNLSEPVVLKFPAQSRLNRGSNSCVFWKEKARQWSSAGCSLCPHQSSKESVECCCNHLTSFAVLFSPEKKPSSEDDGVHAKILSIISYVGCVISLIGVILTFLTYSIFRHLRKTNQQPILMNLCIAIALLLIVFVAGINSTNNILGCQIVAVLLHYLTLVTVLWMGIEAYNLYLQIVKVMAIYQRRFMLKAALVGWGVPLLIVLATVIAAAAEYNGDTSEPFSYGSNYACVLHKYLYSIIAWFVPILAVLLFNLFMFISVIYHLRNALATTDSKSRMHKQCWTAIAIMCLLGLTWLFGALAISDARIVFEYLFCIFNSLQGFFIFFFHCLRIKEVRSQWSVFVSGLGFSRRDSEAHSTSKRTDKSQHENPYRYSDLPPKIVKTNGAVDNTSVC